MNLQRTISTNEVALKISNLDRIGPLFGRRKQLKQEFCQINNFIYIYDFFHTIAIFYIPLAFLEYVEHYDQPNNIHWVKEIFKYLI